VAVKKTAKVVGPSVKGGEDMEWKVRKVRGVFCPPLNP